MLVLLMQKFLCEAVRLLTVAIILDISITTITMTTTTTTSIIVNYYFYYYIWLWTICRWFKSLQVHWVGRNLVPTVESPERKWDRSLTRWHFWGLMTKKNRVFYTYMLKCLKSSPWLVPWIFMATSFILLNTIYDGNTLGKLSFQTHRLP